LFIFFLGHLIRLRARERILSVTLDIVAEWRSLNFHVDPRFPYVLRTS
jgi:hypothetical protein